MKTTKYIGATRLLPEPKEANGKKYPFAFDSDMPDKMHTAYRLVSTSDPHALTDASLTAMLEASKHGGLLADLDHNEGYPLSWITIYPDGSGSSGANNDGVRAQFEKGPSLEITRVRPEEPSRQRILPPPPPPDPGLQMGW